MTPSTAKKHGLIYRYYISRALQEGHKNECGSHPRVAADQVEGLVIDALKAKFQNDQLAEVGDDDRTMLRSVQRVIIGKGALHIELADAADDEDGVLQIPWTPRGFSRPKREVLEPTPGAAGDGRPMRSEVRSALIRAMALGRLWLQELTSGKVQNTDEIASREHRSKRSVHMTMSLAFLAPDIIETAVKGALPLRIGITRLTDLPSSWQKQCQMLGLRQPS
jgi:site-specific DNA recombinase